MTGSHAFKVGGEVMHGFGTIDADTLPVSYTFRNQLPVSLTQVATPYRTVYRIKPQVGIYGQDQSILRRPRLPHSSARSPIRGPSRRRSSVTGAPRAYTNAEILPSLGRNLSACPAAGACTATVLVSLLEPNTIREDRLTQLDLRLSKTVRKGRARLQGIVDIFNVFNASTVLLVNTSYGSQWLRPLEVLPGRFFKFGAQLDF